LPRRFSRTEIILLSRKHLGLQFLTIGFICNFLLIFFEKSPSLLFLFSLTLSKTLNFDLFFSYEPNLKKGTDDPSQIQGFKVEISKVLFETIVTAEFKMHACLRFEIEF
jgi:hypothetical protein